MATGGIFSLLIGDGKSDRLLMVTDALRNRLKAIAAARASGVDASGVDASGVTADVEDEVCVRQVGSFEYNGAEIRSE